MKIYNRVAALPPMVILSFLSLPLFAQTNGNTIEQDFDPAPMEINIHADRLSQAIPLSQGIPDDSILASAWLMDFQR